MTKGKKLTPPSIDRLLHRLLLISHHASTLARRTSNKHSFFGHFWFRCCLRSPRLKRQNRHSASYLQGEMNTVAWR